MNNWTKERFQETFNKVLERAAEDEKFRTLCKTNIYAVIQEMTGDEVPKDIKINVVDSTGYHMSIVLPALQSDAQALTESELDDVSGGGEGGIFSYRGRIIHSSEFI